MKRAGVGVQEEYNIWVSQECAFTFVDLENTSKMILTLYLNIACHFKQRFDKISDQF